MTPRILFDEARKAYGGTKNGLEIRSNNGQA